MIACERVRTYLVLLRNARDVGNDLEACSRIEPTGRLIKEQYFWRCN